MMKLLRRTPVWKGQIGDGNTCKAKLKKQHGLFEKTCLLVTWSMWRGNLLMIEGAERRNVPHCQNSQIQANKKMKNKRYNPVPTTSNTTIIIIKCSLQNLRLSPHKLVIVGLRCAFNMGVCDLQLLMDSHVSRHNTTRSLTAGKANTRTRSLARPEHMQ